MFKTLQSGWKILVINWKASRWFAVLAVASKLYESTLFPFVQVACLAKLLDIISKGGGYSLAEIVYLGVVYVAAAVAKVTMTSFLDTQQPYLDNQLEAYLDLQISSKLATLDPATMENTQFQNLLMQIETTKGSIQAQLTRFIAFIDGIFKFFIACAVLMAVMPWFIILILVFTGPSFAVMNAFRYKMWPYFIEKRSEMVRVTQYVKSILSMDSTSKEVTIFGSGDMLLEKIRGLQKKYFKEFQNAVGSGMVGIILARLLQLGAFIFAQYINLTRVLKGVMPIGSFTLVFQQTFNLAIGCEAVLDQYSSMSMRTKYFDKYFEFLRSNKVILNPANPVKIPGNPKPPEIEFKNVFFRYPGTERWILEDFSMKINSGEKVALVGENGAGKTTIIKLLLRFYDVTQGVILINGIDMRKVDLDEWHTLTGALFQDFIKYQFTLKENVLLGRGRERGTEEELVKALTKSGAMEYTEKLPEKFDQVVGKMFDGGIDLSGGQWQKLALARAFYRDAEILILDEPTSAIDAKAEYEIFERINKLEEDKTVIIISHRFSTVRNADRILVLENGKITEEGNHKQLMNKSGVYADLFNLQAKGYQ